MHKVVSIQDLYPVFLEKLQSGGSFVLTITGSSMFPLFRHGKDSIEVFPVSDRLKKNDMPLYRRDTGQFVMHRIVGFDGNGDYILCGDNQFSKEHHIRHGQIVGVVRGFTRNGRHASCGGFWYKAYCGLLPPYRFAHRCYQKARSLAGRAKRFLIRKVFGRT